MKAGAATHYQEICPACRRALFGLAQGALWIAPTETTETTAPTAPTETTAPTAPK
jgi:hypothetical protein